MVKKIVLSSLVFSLSLTLTGCFFFGAPEHTNPFDPLYSTPSCQASRIGGDILVSWNKTPEADLITYRVINSVSAEEMRKLVMDYLVQSNESYVRTSTNIYSATTTNVLLPGVKFDLTVPQYFAVIYRTSKSAKGSSIATIQP